MLSVQFIRERALLLSSVVLTVIMMAGVGIVSYDAITIRHGEEIEEDTSNLLLNAEQWLNHQQQTNLAITKYVFLGDSASLVTIEENRRNAVDHELAIKKILAEYGGDEAEARVNGLLAFTTRHQRKIDEIIDLKKSGNDSAAKALLLEDGFQHFVDGAGLIISQITKELNDLRSEANSSVSRNVLIGSISFGLMTVLVVAVIWGSYAITNQAQKRNRELSAQLLERATHDPLTGLPNRDLFYDRLSQSISRARRRRRRLAVLYLDLDGFKAVNDIHGHQIGDATLKEAARRLCASIREVDTVARLGGDEFAIVLNEINSPADTEVVAEKIIGRIRDPMPLYGGQTYEIGTSIGIALYPDSAVEIDRLVKAADQAMYDSKIHGKNRYTHSEPNLGEGASADGWITFDDDFAVGVAIIDEQHESLITKLNRLNAAVAVRQGLDQLLVQLDDFIEFTAMHFKTEEDLMDQYHCPDAATHKMEHRRLLGEVQHLRARFAEGGELLVLQWLKDWLIGHVAGSDRRLSADLIAAGVK